VSVPLSTEIVISCR